MPEIAKWLIFAGLGIALLGLLVWLGSKTGIPFGQLPGDIHISKEKYSFYFPIVSSIIASVGLTILINLGLALMRR